MLSSVVFNSPFSIIRYIVGTSAFLFDLLLIYAVWKHTPIKMQEIKPILLTMVVGFGAFPRTSDIFQGILCLKIQKPSFQTTEMLAGQSGGLACAPEYLYPLPVLRINGYFKLMGTYYGGVVAVSSVSRFLKSIPLGGCRRAVPHPHRSLHPRMLSLSLYNPVQMARSSKYELFYSSKSWILLRGQFTRFFGSC